MTGHEMTAIPSLQVKHLKKNYALKSLFQKALTIKAVNDLSFDLYPGETLAIVGESGCGKSTIAKCITGIENPSEGQIFLSGRERSQWEAPELRRQVQMIFQDPYGSLNPRKKAWQLIAEPLEINSSLSKKELRAKAVELMQKVGLRPEQADRYPHMFSGGQRQRIGIARALILEPKVIVCDEPVSALDVSIQAQILNLLLKLQRELGLSYLFISHDLGVVRLVADRVAIVYLGRIVEYGTCDQIFRQPKHPYTKNLIAASPSVDFDETSTMPALAGELPSPISPPPGCAFHKRCPIASEVCREKIPSLEVSFGRLLACHHPDYRG